MTTILIISGIILFILFIIGKSKTTPSSTTTSTSYSTPKPTVKTNYKSEGPLLYKKKGIKSFEMKGMYYRDLNPKSHSGQFTGFAECEDNTHDMYAVGIYNGNNELLGYTPKGNKRLNTSLQEWNNGKVLVWGSLYYNDYEDRWSGLVYIPVGLTSAQLQKVEQILKLFTDNKEQIDKKEKSTEKYFEILERHKEIKKLLSELKNPKEFNYSSPKNLLPSISSYLEKEKKWEKLIMLEQYQDLISELNEKFRETTLKRIEKAKKNIA